MKVNFMNLKPNYKTCDIVIKVDMIVVQDVQAYLIVRLWELTQYPLTFRALYWTQQAIFGSGHYNTINYAVIPRERLDNCIVGKQNNNLSP